MTMLTDSEIHKRFTELWKEKGDLLVYKSFVSLYPGYALWYDQIYGSIPPEGEVEIADCEMDCQTGESCLGAVYEGPASNGGSIISSKLEEKKVQTYTDADGKEQAYSDVSNTDLMYSGVNTEEHRYSDASYEGQIYSDDTSKEHMCSDANNEEHTYKGVSSKEHVYSDANNKEHIYSDASNKEHICNDTNNKEHIYNDATNKEEDWPAQNSELHCSTTIAMESEKSTLKRKLTMNVDLQTFSRCGKKLRTHSRKSHPEQLERRTVDSFSSHGDSSTKKLLELAKIPDLGVPSVENKGVSKEIVPDCKISHENSSTKDEIGGQMSQCNENGYSSLKLQENCCKNCYSIDEGVEFDDSHEELVAVDEGVEFADSHEELIANLRDTHGDLRNQVYSHVKDRFTRWVRSNEDGEFDVSCLDEDLVAVYPVSETKVVWVDSVGDYHINDELSVHVDESL